MSASRCCARAPYSAESSKPRYWRFSFLATASVVPLPVGALIKLQPAAAADTVAGSKEVARLVERALSQMSELADR